MTQETKGRKPSEGAMALADCLNLRPKAVAAKMVDDIAVAPAVRELAKAALYAVDIIDEAPNDDLTMLRARDRLADAAAPYRHLLESEGER